MRNVRLGIGFLIVLTGIFVFWKFFPDAPSPQTDTRPLVVTTIFPLYDIVKQIGGDSIRAELILPPGASEHTFEPTPKAQRDIEEAEIIFSIGHGLDNWLYTLTTDAKKIVVVDNGIILKKEEETVDPHYWLTLENGAKIAQTIAGQLITLFPDQAEQIKGRTEVYQTLLESTDKKLKEQVALRKGKKLVVFHDAWTYFADAYGFEIVGTFEPTPGREPTPQYLSELKKIVTANHLSTLYAEPQFSTRGIESFIADYNLTLSVLDPVGGGEQTGSFIELITSNVETILNNPE